jgi:ribosomal protein L30E
MFVVEEDSKLKTGSVFTGSKTVLSKVTSEKAEVLLVTHIRRCYVNNMHRHAQFADVRETTVEEKH